MENSWYKSSFLRCLVDMHIPSGENFLSEFDPEAYAENMKIAGVDAAYIYASNCLGLALYPSNIAPRHSEAEKRDLFGETVAACRRRGLKVIGYLNNLEQTATNFHPNWRSLDSKGNTNGGRYCFPCLNSPFREYFMNLVLEMVSRYDIDGLWIDMIGFWKPVCYCKYCQDAYLKITGHQLPEIMDYTSKEWVNYLDFKQHVTATYGQQIYESAKSVKNHITVGLQCASILSGHRVALNEEYFLSTDYTAGDFFVGRDRVNVICRMLYSISRNLPFEFMTSRCPSLSYHTTFRPTSELIRQAFAALLYNGSFLFIDAIDPDGGMNADFYRDIYSLREAVDPYIPYIDYDEKPVRDIAVYVNFDSFCDIDSENGKHPESMGYGQKMANRLCAISQAFSRAGLDWAIINRQHLNKLHLYKVIILPNIDRLSDDEFIAIHDYVENGGALYMSGHTSLLNTNGIAYNNFKFADMAGIDIDESTSFKQEPGYIVPAEGEEALFGRYTKRYPNILEGRIFKIIPRNNTEIIATVALPYSDKKDINVFSTALSDPPYNYTEYPALTEHEYGKGRVIYASGVLEDTTLLDNQELFVRIIERLAPVLHIKAYLPECVDYVVYRGNKRYRIGFLNSQQECIPPLPIFDIRLELKLEKNEKIKRIFSVTTAELDWSVTDGTLQLKLDKLDDFQTVIVELE